MNLERARAFVKEAGQAVREIPDGSKKTMIDLPVFFMFAYLATAMNTAATEDLGPLPTIATIAALGFLGEAMRQNFRGAGEFKRRYEEAGIPLPHR